MRGNQAEHGYILADSSSSPGPITGIVLTITEKLESAGIEVGPVSQRLKRLPALRSKHPAPP